MLYILSGESPNQQFGRIVGLTFEIRVSEETLITKIMKETKIVKKTYDSEETISITCDICHTKYKDDNWNADWYKLNETEISITIRHKQGDQYPEGGSGTEMTIDICPKCFTEKLIPWIKSFGTELKEKEWNY